MSRRRRGAAAPLPPTVALTAAALAAVALSGCAALAGAPEASSEPGAVEQRPAVESQLDGPQLVAEGRAFEPSAADVDPLADCEGLDGRASLEVLDRAAWPALDVAAGGATMTCGNADGAGWRHIAHGHTGDFAELAALVDAEWDDVAWFAIERALEQPTRVEAYRDDIVNYDVLVELVDDGRVERAWMVTVGVGLGSERIITAFPDEER